MSEPRKHLPLRPEARSGIALALSGGGFRAALYHLGGLQRLNELGLLPRVQRISSVSGGSIASAVLANQWNELKLGPGGSFENLTERVIEPLRTFCKQDLRTRVLVWSRANPIHWWRHVGHEASVTDRLVDAYGDPPLALSRRLEEIKPGCRFIFCATNLETGRNWEFEIGPGDHAVIGDHWTQHAPAGKVTLAQAVAASSAFPPGFPPLVLKPDDPDAFPQSRVPRSVLESISLTDGGVYDNLGLEPVWKDAELLLVSDAGAPFRLSDDPEHDLIHRLLRCYAISDDQSRALRKRWLISNFINEVLDGTYWGISTKYTDYELPSAQGYDGPVLDAIASVRTDLDSFSEGEIACLENHGYALADAAVRRHVDVRYVSRPQAHFQWPHAAYAPGTDAAWKAVRDSRDRGIVADLWRSVAWKVASLFDRDA